MIDGHNLLADWFFLISAILFVLFAFATYIGTTVAPKVVAAFPYVAGALIALGLWVL